MYQLYIANKNYSSWSMRPWLVLKAFNLPFEEISFPFHQSVEQAHLNRIFWRLTPMLKSRCWWMMD